MDTSGNASKLDEMANPQERAIFKFYLSERVHVL
jgi:hypothetical protein